MVAREAELILTGRSKLSINDVKEVESFDSEGAVLLTTRGTLTVEGSDIHISNLDTSGGAVEIVGKIDALIFASEGEGKKRTLKAKLFG